MSQTFDMSMFDVRPCADRKNIVQGGTYRFTVLTDRLIRMEYAPGGVFEDRATQLALCRNLGEVDFKVTDTENLLRIETEYLELCYDKKPFSRTGLTVRYKDAQFFNHSHWSYHMDDIVWQNTAHFGRNNNLGGTTCTLDSIDGATDLDDGLVQLSGFYALEDNESMVLTDSGWFAPEKPRTDCYLFYYMRDHRAAVRDFYRLIGTMPMIPRYALGNWWSRYYVYTEETYLDLMEKFREEKVPLAVAVIDMDWHLTSVPEGCGNGWTGYTWNRELFPDPKRFLQALHKQNLAVTMNLHPHSGVRNFEDAYPRIAGTMGVKDGETVRFRADDEKSMHALLDDVLHPMEDEGVDFWWIDWQQFDAFAKGYDPLWMLNHCFYTDNARKGNYPMTFSRYAGPSSSRYPIGFSGDTFMSWESLDFQPYFTATASNIGYSWWSHDIGGHKCGIWDDALQVRWAQFGVFSPIMRLHSGKDPLYIKEPWNFPLRERTIMDEFMRLRHKLIPYLYTMNYRNHKDGQALMEPLYYAYPDLTRTLEFKNQYLFGSELMVCPITAKEDAQTLMGSIKAWLPDGVWFDFFSHRAYRGNRRLTLHRRLEDYPVLAKAGAIVPLTADEDLANGVALPRTMEVKIFGGADGAFTLYEDDGKLHNTRSAATAFAFTWGKQCALTVTASGDLSVLPQERTYQLRLIGCGAVKNLTVNGKKTDAVYCREANCATVTVTAKTGEAITVAFACDGEVSTPDVREWVVQRLARMQYSNDGKAAVYAAVQKNQDRLCALSDVISIVKEPEVLSAITECLTSF